jgi:hypothetical protein
MGFATTQPILHILSARLDSPKMHCRRRRFVAVEARMGNLLARQSISLLLARAKEAETQAVLAHDGVPLKRTLTATICRAGHRCHHRCRHLCPDRKRRRGECRAGHQHLVCARWHGLRLCPSFSSSTAAPASRARSPPFGIACRCRGAPCTSIVTSSRTLPSACMRRSPPTTTT